MNCAFHPATVWKPYPVIELDSTAFGSTANTVSVFRGLKQAPQTWKLLTIIEVFT
jgi:hypothetical protein